MGNSIKISSALIAILQFYHITCLAFYQQPDPVASTSDVQVPETPVQSHHPHHHAHAHGFAGQNIAGGIMLGKLQQFHIPGHQHGNWPAMGMPHMQIHQTHLNLSKLFYRDCGVSVRHCEWRAAHHIRPVKGTAAKVHQQHVNAQAHNPHAKVEMEHICSTTRHVCVGNFEGCVSNRTCTAMMKVTESTVEIRGKEPVSAVINVGYLSACDVGEQDISETLTRPQLLGAIGFATYDEAGKTLECRVPKASDFKMIRLRRNSSVEEASKSTGYCMPRKNGEIMIQWADQKIMREVQMWPRICNAMESKEEAFSLKSFLDNHSPVTVFTDFFRPPFNFAENFEPEFSSNGMLVTGSVV